MFLGLFICSGRLCLVIEDIQAIDSESLQVLKQLIELGKKSAAFTVILSYRNDDQKELEWVNHLEIAETVTLQRLGQSDVVDTLRLVGFSDAFVGSAAKSLFVQCVGSPLTLQLMLEAVVNHEKALEFSEADGWSFQRGMVRECLWFILLDLLCFVSPSARSIFRQL